jgi:phosphopantetheinyl transferase
MNSKTHIYLEQHMQTIRLTKQNVTIYILDITDLSPDELETADDMPGERYEKMKRYRNEADRSRHLGNELLFYYGVKTLYGIDDAGGKKGLLTRTAGHNGKPYIKRFFQHRRRNRRIFSISTGS